MSSPTTSTKSAFTPAAPSLRGRIVWHDMMTPDVDASKQFYGAVFGWTYEPMPGPKRYEIYSYRGTQFGGFMPFMEDMKGMNIPPHWMTYFAAPHVDAMAEQVKALGGRIEHGPEDILPDIGRFAVAQDPQGAYFVLFQPNGPDDGRNEMAPVGDASWHELWTTDTVAAQEFYAKLLGWQSAGEFDMGPGMGIYRMFGRNGLPLGGMATITESMKDVPPNWLPYFRVEDVRATVERVRANGGAVLMDVMEVPGGDHVAMCRDSVGGHFAVHEPKSA